MAHGEKSAKAYTQTILGWNAPQFARSHRSWIWYFLAALVNGALLYYAYWSASWTMALAFGLLPIVFLLGHYNKPQNVRVNFSEYGVKFGVIQIPYSSIKAFWILHDPPYVDELRLRTNNKWHPEVVIPLMGVNPALVRKWLVTQVPEWEGKDRSFTDIITHILRLH
jgi:hypothetical protein